MEQIPVINGMNLKERYPEYGCHREFSLKLEWFWRWEPRSQWPLVTSIKRNLACMAALVGANPLKPAHPMPFPLETVFAGERLKGDERSSD